MPMIDNYGSIIFLWFYMLTIWITVIIAWKNKPENPTSSWKWVLFSFVILAFGDVFHLVPRTYLWIEYQFNGNTAIYETDLGISIYAIGLILTSITMTIFYLGLYYFWRAEYIENKDINQFSSIKDKIKTYGLIFQKN